MLSNFIDYFASIGAAEQQALLDGIAEFGADFLFPPLPDDWPKDRGQEMAIHSGFGPYDKAMHGGCPGGPDKRFLSGLGPRYLGIKDVSRLAEKRGWLKSSELHTQSPRTDLLPDIKVMKPAKKSLLTKLIDRCLKQLLNGEIEKGSFYCGFIGSSKVSIEFDPDPRLGNQLVYDVKVENNHHLLDLGLFSNRRHHEMPYETLWCQSTFGWDYLTEENAERSIELLPQLIVYLVQLADRVNELAINAVKDR